jgi:hypothetical protein
MTMEGFLDKPIRMVCGGNKEGALLHLRRWRSFVSNDPHYYVSRTIVGLYDVKLTFSANKETRLQ